MKIAVLSGKGGTGKTFVAVNLATVSGNAIYIDCDVEEPNGALFFKPTGVSKSVVATRLPTFDAAKCTGCRKCVDFCRFNALAFIRGKPMILTEICHSCGGCALVCPANAVSETERTVGVVESGQSDSVCVVTGRMNVGETSGIPVIRAAMQQAGSGDGLTVIDCPPGSACSVMECVRGADYCLLIAEPTAFGQHNLEMVYELVRLMKKPCGVVINKASGRYPPLEAFCSSRGIKVLCRIPYSEQSASFGANGQIAALQDTETSKCFQHLLAVLRKEVGR